jgi:hypothetical protein
MFSLMPEVDDSHALSEVRHIDKCPLGIRPSRLGFRAIAGLFTSREAGFRMAVYQEMAENRRFAKDARRPKRFQLH